MQAFSWFDSRSSRVWTDEALRPESRGTDMMLTIVNTLGGNYDFSTQIFSAAGAPSRMVFFSTVRETVPS